MYSGSYPLLTERCQQAGRRMCSPLNRSTIMQATTAITWFEIPAKDLERAVWFYESVLQQDLRRETMGQAAMAVFPHQEPGIGGALTHAPSLTPAADGSIIYLRTQHLEETLQRVTRAGGRVVQ